MGRVVDAEGPVRADPGRVDVAQEEAERGVTVRVLGRGNAADLPGDVGGRRAAAQARGVDEPGVAQAVGQLSRGP